MDGTNELLLAAEDLAVKMPQNDGGRRMMQTRISVLLSWSFGDKEKPWHAVLAFCCP